MSSTERIDYRGWEIEVQRKAFRRSISIVLKPGKPIQVRASKGTTLHAIVNFLETRKDWIKRHLADFAEQEKSLPKAQLLVGGRYPLMGKELTLRTCLTPLSRVFFSADETELILHLPKSQYQSDLTDVSFAHPELREFYRLRAEKHLEQRFSQWVAETGLKPRTLQIREAKTRWGSCHPDGKVILNWRLAVYPTEVIDYVIVHELCHLKHMNHSRSFWQLVQKIMPEMKERMEYIRTHHRLADFLDKSHSKKKA